MNGTHDTGGADQRRREAGKTVIGHQARQRAYRGWDVLSPAQDTRPAHAGWNARRGLVGRRNVGAVTLTIEDNDAPEPEITYTLSGPEDPNLVEGKLW